MDLIVGVLSEMDRLERGELGTRQASQRVRYDLRPVRGEGRSSANSPIDAADEVWRRLDIRSERDADGRLGALEFTSIGRLARAERLLGRAESDLIEPLIADAISREADPDVSGTLYELLVPPALKGELGSGEHLQLLVDEGTADLPWELLSPRPEDQEQKVPLALRVGVLRQFRETEGLRFGVRRASGDRALVVGNPPTAGAYGPLYGAVRESVEVARRLRAADWDVTSLIWDGDQRVVDGRVDRPDDRPDPSAAGAARADERRLARRAHRGPRRLRLRPRRQRRGRRRPAPDRRGLLPPLDRARPGDDQRLPPRPGARPRRRRGRRAGRRQPGRGQRRPGAAAARHAGGGGGRLGGQRRRRPGLRRDALRRAGRRRRLRGGGGRRPARRVRARTAVADLGRLPVLRRPRLPPRHPPAPDPRPGGADRGRAAATHHATAGQRR